MMLIVDAAGDDACINQLHLASGRILSRCSRQCCRSIWAAAEAILSRFWSKFEADLFQPAKDFQYKCQYKIQITKCKRQNTKYKKTRKRNWMFGTVLGAGEPPLQLPEVTEARVCLWTCCIPWTVNIYMSWTLNIKHCFNRRNFQPKMLRSGIKWLEIVNS